ncbi:type I-E CRISPR-associated protein Cse1/CasA [Sulfitobacter sp. 1A13353]|uniref:type I-E CRISPR-associated protein Cse1/CasA n=1 Tax=Sulfitobacter sp. 1A13353 TaxID=3368568 RepID=UPI0037474A4E
MSLNLIMDPWIPVVTTDGRRRVIRPHEMIDAEIRAVDWHREDLNIACLEFLVGLSFAALAPEDLEAWEDGLEIEPDDLEAAFTRLAPAFNLTGEGPLFCQDQSMLSTGNELQADALFLDSAGEKTISDNKDLMVRRNRYDGLTLPEAAMALFTFQTYAAANGVGKRVGLRGGGPMVTLVVPGENFWEMIWANVPYGRPARLEDFPWMRETISSSRQATTKGKSTAGATVTLPLGMDMPVETFFSMPRRVRLTFQGDRMISFREQTYGTNYIGCLHPLTPNYTDPKTKDIIPVKVNVTRLGYENWIGTIIPAEQGVGRERAANFRSFEERFPGQSASVLIAGWNMNKATAANFISSQPVLHSLSGRNQVLVRGMIKAADIVSSHTYRAIKDAMDIPYGMRIQTEFYMRTEVAMNRLCAELSHGKARPEIGAAWLLEMQHSALSIFDEITLPCMTQRDLEVIPKIVKGRQGLEMRFNTKARSSAPLRALLEMDEELSS